MNNEMPNLQPVMRDKKYKFPKKSTSEAEGENFSHYVMEILRKKGEYALADSIEEKKISLGLEANKAVETGNLAEKSNSDFNAVDHMTKRAEMIAEELIEKKKEYSH